VPPRPGYGPDGAAASDDDDDDGAASQQATWPWRWHPLLTTVLLPALPRGASVELQPLALMAGDPSWGDDADDDVVAGGAAAADGNGSAVWVSRRFCRAHGACAAGAEHTAAAVAAVAALASSLAAAQLAWADVYCLRVYHTDAVSEATWRDAWASALKDAAAVAPLFVPVLGVVSAGGAHLAALAELSAWWPAQLDR
jgi:hypothetical protein